MPAFHDQRRGLTDDPAAPVPFPSAVRTPPGRSGTCFTLFHVVGQLRIRPTTGARSGVKLSGCALCALCFLTVATSVQAQDIATETTGTKRLSGVPVSAKARATRDTSEGTFVPYQGRLLGVGPTTYRGTLEMAGARPVPMQTRAPTGNVCVPRHAAGRRAAAQPTHSPPAKHRVGSRAISARSTGQPKVSRRATC